MKVAFRDLSTIQACTVAIFFLSFCCSLASDDLCLSDAEISHAGPQEATKCQALLQSGLQQKVSSVAEVHADESDVETQEPKSAPKEAPKIKKAEGDGNDKKAEGSVEPILEMDPPKVESSITPEVPSKEEEGAVEAGTVAKNDDYFHSDFPFDDPESQRLGGSLSGGVKHDDSWEKDYPWDDNRGLPNKLQVDSYNRKKLEVRSAPIKAAKAPSVHAKKAEVPKEPSKAPKVEAKATPKVQKATAVAKAPAKVADAAPKSTAIKMKEPPAKPVDQAKVSTEGLDGPVQISRSASR